MTLAAKLSLATYFRSELERMDCKRFPIMPYSQSRIGSTEIMSSASIGWTEAARKIAAQIPSSTGWVNTFHCQI